MSALSFASAAACLVLTATTVASCGGGGHRGGEALGIDDFPAAFQAATCEVRVLCSASPDLQTCDATVLGAGSQGVLTLVEAVKRGTTLFDGAAMRACLDALGRDCFVYESPPAACEQALQGQLPAGSTCVTSEECAGGGTCEKPCVGDACCMGTCAARVPSGGACATGRCSKGTFCHQGVCTTSLSPGAACTESGGCAAPSFCAIPAGAATGTCTLPGAAGSPCDPVRTFPCGRIDERCDPTVNRCVKVVPVGAACTRDRDCAFYAHCVQGVCVALPTAGATCEPSAIPACQGTLACVSGTCAARATPSACVPTN